MNCRSWTTSSRRWPSEFDTLDELKADSRKRLENMKQYDQATQAQERVLEKLLELVEVPIPEKLLEDEVKTRKHNLEHHQLGQMGLDLEKYLEIQGKTVEEFDAETAEQAVKGIKTQFVLDELVNKEKLNVNQEELTEHLMRRAQSSGMSPDQFAQAVVEGGQVPMLVGEVARGKALAVVVEAATVKDTNGEVVDLEDDEDEAAEPPARPPRRAAEAEATTRPRRATRPEPRGLDPPASPGARTPRVPGPVVGHRCAQPCAHCATLRSQRTVPEAGWRCPTCALGSMNTRAEESRSRPKAVRRCGPGPRTKTLRRP